MPTSQYGLLPYRITFTIAYNGLPAPMAYSHTGLLPLTPTTTMAYQPIWPTATQVYYFHSVPTTTMVNQPLWPTAIQDHIHSGLQPQWPTSH